MLYINLQNQYFLVLILRKEQLNQTLKTVQFCFPYIVIFWAFLCLNIYNVFAKDVDSYSMSQIQKALAPVSFLENEVELQSSSYVSTTLTPINKVVVSSFFFTPTHQTLITPNCFITSPVPSSQKGILQTIAPRPPNLNTTSPNCIYTCTEKIDLVTLLKQRQNHPTIRSKNRTPYRQKKTESHITEKEKLITLTIQSKKEPDSTIRNKNRIQFQQKDKEIYSHQKEEKINLKIQSKKQSNYFTNERKNTIQYNPKKIESYTEQKEKRKYYDFIEHNTKSHIIEKINISYIDQKKKATIQKNTDNTYYTKEKENFTNNRAAQIKQKEKIVNQQYQVSSPLHLKSDLQFSIDKKYTINKQLDFLLIQNTRTRPYNYNLYNKTAQYDTTKKNRINFTNKKKEDQQKENISIINKNESIKTLKILTIFNTNTHTNKVKNKQNINNHISTTPYPFNQNSNKILFSNDQYFTSHLSKEKSALSQILSNVSAHLLISNRERQTTFVPKKDNSLELDCWCIEKNTCLVSKKLSSMGMPYLGINGQDKKYYWNLNTIASSFIDHSNATLTRVAVEKNQILNGSKIDRSKKEKMIEHTALGNAHLNKTKTNDVDKTIANNDNVSKKSLSFTPVSLSSLNPDKIKEPLSSLQKQGRSSIANSKRSLMNDTKEKENEAIPVAFTPISSSTNTVESYGESANNLIAQDFQHPLVRNTGGHLIEKGVEKHTFTPISSSTNTVESYGESVDNNLIAQDFQSPLVRNTGGYLIEKGVEKHTSTPISSSTNTAESYGESVNSLIAQDFQSPLVRNTGGYLIEEGLEKRTFTPISFNQQHSYKCNFIDTNLSFVPSFKDFFIQSNKAFEQKNITNKTQSIDNQKIISKTDNTQNPQTLKKYLYFVPFKAQNALKTTILASYLPSEQYNSPTKYFYELTKGLKSYKIYQNGDNNDSYVNYVSLNTQFNSS